MISDTLRLSDLNAPELTNEQRQMLAEAERSPVALSEEAVTSAAIDRTGLEDFGPEDFRPSLRSILAEVEADENVTEFCRRTFFTRSVASCANRLVLFDLLRRHPEIHDVEIKAPLVIAGLPRSGTTHLVNLVCADDRLQSLPYWLALEPLLPPDRSKEGDGARFERTEETWRRMQMANPTMAAYHPMAADHIHEDVELQLPDFSSYTWEWWSRMPNWRDSYLARDQTSSYEYARTVLKAVQWQRGDSRRWVLKAPQHFEQLQAVMNVYPDAIVAFTHRDPVASLQSIVTQLAYRSRMRERHVDPAWQYAYWTDRVERLLEAFQRDRGIVPPEQRFDVRFDEFMADDVAMVERIFRGAGLETTAESRRRLGDFMDGHQRGRYGRVDHDLRRDFGADPDQLWRRFSGYAAAVGIDREVE
jgi:hypothetical protein